MPDPVPYLNRRPGRNRNKHYFPHAARTEEKRAATAFYLSPAWRELRRWHLINNPLCKACLDRGVLKTATVVDHVIPRKDAPFRSLDRENIQSLCASCHARKSNAERRARAALSRRRAPCNSIG